MSLRKEDITLLCNDDMTTIKYVRILESKCKRLSDRLKNAEIEYKKLRTEYNKLKGIEK